MDSKESLVQLASKKDLMAILLFLEERLPHTYDLYQSAMSSAPMDKFYFTRGSDGIFNAIFALRMEHCTDHTGALNKIWITCQWYSDERSLFNIYQSINEIDWTRDFFLVYGYNHHPPEVIQQLFADWQLQHLKTYPMQSFYLDIETALNIQIQPPDDVYVKSLERCHASIVFQYWPYSQYTTVDDVADEIDRQPSAGVFLKNGDQLVSWVMGRIPNGMSRLHTLDQYRRRGYAALAVKYVSKRMAQCGYLPFANIVIGNETSKKFFQSLGFRLCGDNHITAKCFS